MKNHTNCHRPPAHRRGFTLIELLVVISIMGILAAFTISVLGKMKESQYKKVARGELEHLAAALDNYKAKYGAYPPANQLGGTALYAPAMFNQLYYELSGTRINNNNFVTLDGASQIAMNVIPANSDVYKAYGVGGFINCTKGGGDEAASAQNFLPGLKPNQIYQYITNNSVQTTELVTAVGGPDDNYLPLGGNSSGINPFRYVCPGTNNPNSYDLWVQLQIKGKKYLICNWSPQPIANSPLP